MKYFIDIQYFYINIDSALCFQNFKITYFQWITLKVTKPILRSTQWIINVQSVAIFWIIARPCNLTSCSNSPIFSVISQTFTIGIQIPISNSFIPGEVLQLIEDTNLISMNTWFAKITCFCFWVTKVILKCSKINWRCVTSSIEWWLMTWEDRQRPSRWALI